MKKTFTIEVVITEDDDGKISSHRNLLSDESIRVTESLPDGGLAHASFGLLQEAIKQEALYQALLLLSQEKPLDSETLTNGVSKTLEKQIEKFVDHIVRATVDSLK